MAIPMTYNHNPFHHEFPNINARIIFSKNDQARVKVKIENPDAEWNVHWGDGKQDVVSSGTHEIIHQYHDTNQGTRYEIKVSKGNQVQIEMIGY